MQYPADLGDGVRQFQSPLWQTNSVVAVANGDVLLCDPAYTPDEIHAIEAEAARHGGATTILITHADFDHVCGIGYFPSAEVVAGADTASRIDEGLAARGLQNQGPEWGVTWPDELRIDRVVPPEGEFAVGPFRVATAEAPSHGRDGVAYVLLDQGILLPGDHLSSITYPFLSGSLAGTRRATERLLEALDRHAPRLVVPGHGPALDRAAAKEVGERDLDYLVRLQQAARETVAEGMPPGHALVHVYAIEPPRATTDDFEIYAIRVANARKALDEAAEAAAA